MSHQYQPLHTLISRSSAALPRTAGIIAAGILLVFNSSRGATPVAWGFNGSGQNQVPPGIEDTVAVSASETHTLALRANGRVAAWGDNSTGACNVPAWLERVQAVSAGRGFSVVLLQDGTALAWGAAGLGQCDVPVEATNLVSVSAGRHHTLARRADGTVVAWGNSALGQYRPEDAMGRAGETVAGPGYSLLVRPDDTVAQLGEYPPPPAKLAGVKSVSAGDGYALALHRDGTVTAWGPLAQSTALPTLAGIQKLVAGYASLALKDDGTLVAWGDPAFGETSLPRGLRNVIAISGSGRFKVALTTAALPGELRITQSQADAQGFALAVPTESGRQYALEYRNSVTDAAWKELSSSTGTGGQVWLRDDSPRGGQRYYRVREW